MEWDQSNTNDRHRPTSYDVARLAGVSQSSVSRCFRPGNSVSQEKRKVILEAAAKLCYEHNDFASNLITMQSNLVAVLISDLTNLYYPQVLAELTQRFDVKGIRVLLFALHNEGDVGEALSQIWRYRVDGAITAVRMTSKHLAKFKRQRVPVVLYNCYAENQSVPGVVCDFVGGERVLIDRLVEAGHRRFVILADPSDGYMGNGRVEGALARLAHHELGAEVFPGGWDHEGGADGLRQAMALEQRPDALVCANDLMAIGAIDAAREEFGLSVPDELSIVGFDGVGPAAWPSYRLTTMRQPVRRMADAAVAMLLERIANPELPPEVCSFSSVLIEGRSARL